MKISYELRENLIAVSVALVLSFWIVYVLNNSQMLKADINVNNQDLNQNIDEQVDSDFLIERWENYFNVIANRWFEGVKNVSVELIYDPRKVKIDIDKVVPTNVSLTKLSSWQLEIFVFDVGSIVKNQPILTIRDVDGRYINVATFQLASTALIIKSFASLICVGLGFTSTTKWSTSAKVKPTANTLNVVNNNFFNIFLFWFKI